MKRKTNPEEEAARQKALLDELLKRSSQAIVLLNSEAEILFCSDSIESITGYPAHELTGLSAFDFFHPQDLAAARNHHEYLNLLNENTSASLLQIRNREQHMIWIDVVVRNLFHIPQINALFVLLRKSSDATTEERKLVEAVAAAREQEREFLATELHDNINQIISATKLLVDTARHQQNKEELLQLSSENLQKAGDEIRKLSYSMVSFDLEEFGLAFALNAFIGTISRACPMGLRTNLDKEALEVLSTEQQLQLYRIIQEGINNIIRHAAATHAEIALSRKEDSIHLTITDNGKGISLNRLKPGVGLSSITNRVKILGGHFHVRAAEGSGTLIEIHFPI